MKARVKTTEVFDPSFVADREKLCFLSNESSGDTRTSVKMAHEQSTTGYCDQFPPKDMLQSFEIICTNRFQAKLSLFQINKCLYFHILINSFKCPQINSSKNSQSNSMLSTKPTVQALSLSEKNPHRHIKQFRAKCTKIVSALNYQTASICTVLNSLHHHNFSHRSCRGNRQMPFSKSFRLLAAVTIQEHFFFCITAWH